MLVGCEARIALFIVFHLSKSETMVPAFALESVAVAGLKKAKVKAVNW